MVGTLGVPPVFYAAVRSTLIGLVLLPMLLPLPPRLGRVILVALFLGTGSFALMFIGLQTATPSAASVVLPPVGLMLEAETHQGMSGHAPAISGMKATQDH